MANQKADAEKVGTRRKLTDASKRALVFSAARHALKEEIKVALSQAALADVRYVETEVDKDNGRITAKIGLRGYYDDRDRDKAVATIKAISGMTEVQADDLGVVITGFRVVTEEEK